MLKHHNDGKGKFQSHEVWFESDKSLGFHLDEHPLNNFDKGYGETYEEAFEDWRIKVTTFKAELNKINLEELKPVAVDWRGNTILTHKAKD